MVSESTNHVLKIEKALVQMLTWRKKCDDPERFMLLLTVIHSQFIAEYVDLSHFCAFVDGRFVLILSRPCLHNTASNIYQHYEHVFICSFLIV